MTFIPEKLVKNVFLKRLIDANLQLIRIYQVTYKLIILVKIGIST